PLTFLDRLHLVDARITMVDQQLNLTWRADRVDCRLDRSEAGLDRTGELYLADISVPAAVYDRLGIRYRSPFERGPVVAVRGLPVGNPT
ncbi:MAG: hypothetical protein ACERKT_08080, partial [Acidobacteriota bacterium]